MKRFGTKRYIAAAVAALAIGGTGFAADPARADGTGYDTGAVAAGVAGFAVGTAFPFVNGYQYHPSGYWYVQDPRYARYPVSYYRWYAPAQGYIYVGPNWRTWNQHRDAVYAAPPYFVVPPKRYVHYPPVPYFYGPGYGVAAQGR